MSLTTGDQLGPYEVLAPLGAGGMGEVFRAKDTRLDREVAIKVLPEALALDPDWRVRFERETKAVAALSHPNILAIFDFGVHDAVAYAAMELRPSFRSLWFRTYLQTYLERDVRAISSIRDLATFRRFLALLASRGGQILNKTALAAPLGVSVHAITEWLNILEITGQLLVVPPFFENFGKRLIKSPKIYFVDSGLVCHLLGIDSEAACANRRFLALSGKASSHQRSSSNR